MDRFVCCCGFWFAGNSGLVKAAENTHLKLAGHFAAEEKETQA